MDASWRWDWLGTMLLGQWVLLAAWFLIAVIGLSFIWRFHAVADRLTLPLNVITGLALLFNLVIIGGYSDGTFRPSNEVTRAQVSKMISLSLDVNRK